MCESRDLICQTVSDRDALGMLSAAPHSGMKALALGRTGGQAPQSRSGAPEAQAVGRLRGGRTARIHALADALGPPRSRWHGPWDIAPGWLDTVAPPRRVLADRA
jgi:hypothetical protein